MGVHAPVMPDFRANVTAPTALTALTATISSIWVRNAVRLAIPSAALYKAAAAFMRATVFVIALIFAAVAVRAALNEAVKAAHTFRVPFRHVFRSYDGTPGKDPVERFSFQIDSEDLKEPSQFLKIGDQIENSPYKLAAFAYKARWNSFTRTKEDVRLLTSRLASRSCW
jgi:hypothetical protein